LLFVDELNHGDDEGEEMYEITKHYGRYYFFSARDNPGNRLSLSAQGNRCQEKTQQQEISNWLRLSLAELLIMLKNTNLVDAQENIKDCLVVSLLDFIFCALTKRKKSSSANHKRSELLLCKIRAILVPRLITIRGDKTLPGSQLLLID
jgi:hypothetical protein